MRQFRELSRLTPESEGVLAFSAPIDKTQAHAFQKRMERRFKCHVAVVLRNDSTLVVKDSARTVVNAKVRL